MLRRFAKDVFIGLNGLALAAVIGLASPASAAVSGPVPRTLLPGGVTFSDSHPGNPRQLGFANGKTFTFENFDLAQFTELLWGVAGIGAVRISLDGAFDSPGETLSFSPGESDLFNGVAVWTGSTRIFTTSGTMTPATVFRMTVRDGSGVPVSLNSEARVDVLALPAGKFSAQLEMLASFGGLPLTFCHPGADPKGQFPGFAPVLRVFDCTATSSGSTGDALTSLETGFFIEVIDVDLAEHNQSLLDHNTAVLDKLGAMMVGTSIIENDWALKWESALGGIGSVDGKVDALGIEIGNLPQEFDDLSQQLGRIPSTEQLAYLLGFNIGPPPEGFPPISSFPAISALYESLDDIETKTDGIDARTDSIETKTDLLNLKVDDITALLEGLEGARKVDIEVVESARLSTSDETFLVLLTENGSPVDAEVTQVLALRDTSGDLTAVETDVYTTPVRTGLLRLEVVLPASLTSAKLYLIRARHAHGTDSSHAGSKLVSLGPNEVQ